MLRLYSTLRRGNAMALSALSVRRCRVLAAPNASTPLGRSLLRATALGPLTPLLQQPVRGMAHRQGGRRRLHEESRAQARASEAAYAETWDADEPVVDVTGKPVGAPRRSRNPRHDRIEEAKVRQRARRDEKEAATAAKEQQREKRSLGSKGNELDAADRRKAIELNPRLLHALVVHPIVKSHRTASLLVDDATRRSQQQRGTAAAVEELVGLVEAAGWRVSPYVEPMALPLQRLIPATLFGDGQVRRVAAARDSADERAEADRQPPVEVVVVDAALTPTQQRNLEAVFGVPVFDRTQLILYIFGVRARSSDAKMQVELATLQHKRSRLVRSQSAHYAQQRASGAGGGFLAGSGESQLEIDHRVLADRIRRLQQQLATVAQHRKRQRAARHLPIVAVVGYTNAGKSLLVNQLSGADLLTQDKLFATLDATARGVQLPSGRRVLLVDTVGFVSQLPHELVAAFRATLEEVLEADVLLHVRDVASDSSAAQRTDVLHVLHGLGVGSAAHNRMPVPIVEVWNKIDKLSGIASDQLLMEQIRAESTPVPALGDGDGDGDGDGQAKATVADDALMDPHNDDDGSGGATGAKSVSRLNKEMTIKFDKPKKPTTTKGLWRRENDEINALTLARVPVSALHRTGFDQLLLAVDAALAKSPHTAAAAAEADGATAAVAGNGGDRGADQTMRHERLVLDLSRPQHARALDWLYANAMVSDRRDGVAEPDAEPLEPVAAAPAPAKAKRGAKKTAATKAKPTKRKTAKTKKTAAADAGVAGGTEAGAEAEDAAAAEEAASSLLVTVSASFDAATQHHFHQAFQPHKLAAPPRDDDSL